MSATTVDGARSGGGFERFGEDAQWFRDLLAEKGVKLKSPSPMDDALKAMTQISYAVTSGKEPGLRDGSELLRLITDAVGARNLINFVRKAVATDPKVFDGKWHLSRGPDVLLARYRGQTPQRNFMWELYVAALCLRGTKNVKIADSDNPDIRCSLREVGWGVECKVPDSRNPASQMKNVKEAARQIEATDVDRG